MPTSKSKSFLQLQHEIESLQKQADLARKREIAEVDAKIKEAVRQYQLTAADLGLSSEKRTKVGRVVKRGAAKKSGKGPRAAKFRDPSGNTWGGRGRRPEWLLAALSAGKKLEDFAI